MSALQIHYVSREASIKRLKYCLGSEANALKKFKKSSWNLGQEAVDLKVKLSAMAQQADELVKENANLKSEVVVLHKYIKKVKEEAIKEYQGS